MKKKLFLPLLAAMVAAGGAIAMNGTATQQSAYGLVGPGDCRAGILVNHEDCAKSPTTDTQCEVEIEGVGRFPAYETLPCNQNSALYRPDPQ